MRAEIGVMQPQVQECWQVQEDRRGKVSSRAPGGSMILPTP